MLPQGLYEFLQCVYKVLGKVVGCHPFGIRAYNLRIRSPTPCPLRQGGLLDKVFYKVFRKAFTPDNRGKRPYERAENMREDISFVLLRNSPQINTPNRNRKILCQGVVENLSMAH